MPYIEFIIFIALSSYLGKFTYDSITHHDKVWNVLWCKQGWCRQTCKPTKYIKIFTVYKWTLFVGGRNSCAARNISFTWHNISCAYRLLQHRCRTTRGWSNWQTIQSNRQRCGYSAYQRVECQIRAHNNNNNRNSDVATDSVYTQCGSKETVTYIILRGTPSWHILFVMIFFQFKFAWLVSMVGDSVGWHQSPTWCG